MSEPVICVECDHFFDPSDKRACVPMKELPDLPNMCPACTMSMWKGAPAWAVWNDCQGIFSDAIFRTKSEAEWMVTDAPYADAACKVVPVRVYVEQEDRWPLREAGEAELER